MTSKPSKEIKSTFQGDCLDAQIRLLGCGGHIGFYQLQYDCNISKFRLDNIVKYLVETKKAYHLSSGFIERANIYQTICREHDECLMSPDAYEEYLKTVETRDNPKFRDGVFEVVKKIRDEKLTIRSDDIITQIIERTKCKEEESIQAFKTLVRAGLIYEVKPSFYRAL